MGNEGFIYLQELQNVPYVEEVITITDQRKEQEIIVVEEEEKIEYRLKIAVPIEMFRKIYL